MNLLEVMSKLYTSEINVNFASFWDAGFQLNLGDTFNGLTYIGEYCSDEFDLAAHELHLAAIRHYPQSEYALENANA